MALYPNKTVPFTIRERVLEPFGEARQLFPVPAGAANFGLFEEAVLWQAPANRTGFGTSRFVANATYILLLTPARRATSLLTGNVGTRITQFDAAIFELFGEPFPFRVSWPATAPVTLPPNSTHDHLISQVWTGEGNEYAVNAQGEVQGQRRVVSQGAGLAPVVYYPFNPATGVRDTRNGAQYGRDFIAYQLTNDDGSRAISGIAGVPVGGAGLHLDGVIIEHDAAESTRLLIVNAGPLPGVDVTGFLDIEEVFVDPALPAGGWTQAKAGDADPTVVRTEPVTGLLVIRGTARGPQLDEIALDGWWRIEGQDFAPDLNGNIRMTGPNEAEVYLVAPMSGGFDQLLRRRSPVLQV